MQVKIPKGHEPRLGKESFICPHCGAFAHQNWKLVYVISVTEETTPTLISNADVERLYKTSDHEFSSIEKKLFRKIIAKEIVVSAKISEATYEGLRAYNLWLSECYACKGYAIWVADKLVWPSVKDGPTPNQDLPVEIKNDFNEAREILNVSPRGAAALLRLCIQKLCKHLGQPGKNLNDDIAALVKKGLNPKVKMALDVVRVIGNHAVHPGAIDLKDDKETALKLLSVTNLIAESMISEQKEIEEMFGKLPDGAKKQITKRDGKE